MYDYPDFDGTQACQDPIPAAASAFAGTIGAATGPALALCAACPFTSACRQWALTHDVYGVWGGTTDDERAAIRTRSEVPTPPSITDQLDDLVIALRAGVDEDEPSLSRAS